MKNDLWREYRGNGRPKPGLPIVSVKKTSDVLALERGFVSGYLARAYKMRLAEQFFDEVAVRREAEEEFARHLASATDRQSSPQTSMSEGTLGSADSNGA